MSYLPRVPLLVLALATVTLASTARASAPAGVWARVDQVSFDPDAKAPTVRVDGVFMVANQNPDFPAYPGYSVPQYGYMFYACQPKELAMCLMQWNELLTVAGSDDNCRGWGDSGQPDNGSVRPTSDPEAKPDLYPIALGVTPGFSPCEALKTWQNQNPPPEDPPPDTSSGTGDPGSTGEAGSTGGEGTTAAPETTSNPGETGGSVGETGGSVGETGVGETGGAPVTESGPHSSDPTEVGGDPSTAATTDATATATTTANATDGQTDDKGGCACNSGGEPGLAALALLGLLAMPRRRGR